MTEDRPLLTILVVAVIATVAALLVTASWEFSHVRIEANRHARLLASLSSVLDPALLDRDLDPVQLTAVDTALLGTPEPTEIFVPVEDSRPLAIIFASTAPDGYNGPIRLLVGIAIPSGSITGVRVIEHRETPGLGDRIERDKSDWILQFDGRSAADPEGPRWTVTAENGAFDAITGATITPRAVIRAVHNTLVYFESHRDELLRAARREAESRTP